MDKYVRKFYACVNIWLYLRKIRFDFRIRSIDVQGHNAVFTDYVSGLLS